MITVETLKEKIAAKQQILFTEDDVLELMIVAVN